MIKISYILLAIVPRYIYISIVIELYTMCTFFLNNKNTKKLVSSLVVISWDRSNNKLHTAENGITGELKEMSTGNVQTEVHRKNKQKNKSEEIMRVGGIQPKYWTNFNQISKIRGEGEWNTPKRKN